MTTALMMFKWGHETKEGNLNKPENDGWTVMMIASQEGHDALVKTLIKEGNKDGNIVNNNGWTALMIASDRGHDAVVSLH